MTLVVDIDDTLLISEKIKCDECGRIKYQNEIKFISEINYLNKLYKNHTIILHTGRNWDCYDITVKQLKKNKIKYHELVMGKPQGIYIDRDAKTSIEEVYNAINSTAKISKY